MKIAWIIAVVSLLGLTSSAQQTLTPERTVHNQSLRSDSMPRADLVLSREYKFIGSRRFVLYGVADAEQYGFVDADSKGEIRSLYWLQFEHFLSTNDKHYDYKPVRTTKFGPLTFIYDLILLPDFPPKDWSADSDGGQMEALLAAKGLKLPKKVALLRMFHLPTSDHRSELMIIHLESLDRGGMPEGVVRETPGDETYPEISRRLLEHVKADLKITAR